MARSEAQKRADGRYRKARTAQVVVRMYPSDGDLLEWLRSKDSMQGYIKRLIREDMERSGGLPLGEADA